VDITKEALGIVLAVLGVFLLAMDKVLPLLLVVMVFTLVMVVSAALLAVAMVMARVDSKDVHPPLHQVPIPSFGSGSALWTQTGVDISMLPNCSRRSSMAIGLRLIWIPSSS
jgi:vacuolar-type H+-ATPase subunit I/STV1